MADVSTYFLEDGGDLDRAWFPNNIETLMETWTQKAVGELELDETKTIAYVYARAYWLKYQSLALMPQSASEGGVSVSFGDNSKDMFADLYNEKAVLVPGVLPLIPKPMPYTSTVVPTVSVLLEPVVSLDEYAEE
jgi:hypothetical protein